LFVSILGVSSYTCAEATHDQQLEAGFKPTSTRSSFSARTDSSSARQHENGGDARLPLRFRSQSITDFAVHYAFDHRPVQSAEQLGGVNRFLHNAHFMGKRAESMRKKRNPSRDESEEKKE
jgi:hypothetical protein